MRRVFSAASFILLALAGTLRAQTILMGPGGLVVATPIWNLPINKSNPVVFGPNREMIFFNSKAPFYPVGHNGPPRFNTPGGPVDILPGPLPLVLDEEGIPFVILPNGAPIMVGPAISQNPVVSAPKPAVIGELAGIPEADFAPHYQRQEDLVWCWAASSQMALSLAGIHLSQQEIILKAKGMIGSFTGSPTDISTAINNIFPTAGGEQILVSGQFVVGTPHILVLLNQMLHKRPVVLTYNHGPGIGHAVVLSEVEYTQSGANAMIHRFHVWDPFAFRQVGQAGTPGAFRPSEFIKYRIYKVESSQNGLLMRNEVGEPVGMVTAVFLVDAFKL